MDTDTATCNKKLFIVLENKLKNKRRTNTNTLVFCSLIFLFVMIATCLITISSVIIRRLLIRRPLMEVDLPQGLLDGVAYKLRLARDPVYLNLEGYRDSSSKVKLIQVKYSINQAFNIAHFIRGKQLEKEYSIKLIKELYPHLELNKRKIKNFYESNIKLLYYR